ncbi:MAG: flagellar protein FlaG [Chloroflexota bacterium]
MRGTRDEDPVAAARASGALAGPSADRAAPASPGAARVHTPPGSSTGRPGEPDPRGESASRLARTDVPHGIVFSVDTERHQVRIEIVDDSGELVRQIPSEDLVRFAESFERFLGLLVDEQA